MYWQHNPKFFSFALWLEIKIHRATQTVSGFTWEEMIIGRRGQNWLDQFHTFSCHVFALNLKLEEDQSLPKWQLRSKIRLYLKLSPQYTQSVPLMLNSQAGLISPQIHCNIDDLFTEIESSKNSKLPTKHN